MCPLSRQWAMATKRWTLWPPRIPSHHTRAAEPLVSLPFRRRGSETRSLPKRMSLPRPSLHTPSCVASGPRPPAVSAPCVRCSCGLSCSGKAISRERDRADARTEAAGPSAVPIRWSGRSRWRPGPFSPAAKVIRSLTRR